MTPTQRRTRRLRIAREALRQLNRDVESLRRRIQRHVVETLATYEAARIEAEQRKEARHA